MAILQRRGKLLREAMVCRVATMKGLHGGARAAATKRSRRRLRGRRLDAVLASGIAEVEEQDTDEYQKCLPPESTKPWRTQVNATGQECGTWQLHRVGCRTTRMGGAQAGLGSDPEIEKRPGDLAWNAWWWI
uniref:Uncharacterized protein n=1 Tax=Triticum urartu TaxID=4572 RepID=A0A8R7TTG5_TRIUA